MEHCVANKAAPFPLEDVNVHDFLRDLLLDRKTAGTTGKAFLEAVRFSGAMLGLRRVEVQMIFQRVSGLAEMLMKRAPTIAQAIRLTVEQIKKLERVSCSSGSIQDRVILGGILVMIYGSARASDMARAVRLTVDRGCRPPEERPDTVPVGFLEVGVLCHKGARSDNHRRLLLPVVAPMVCLSGAPWSDA